VNQGQSKRRLRVVFICQAVDAEDPVQAGTTRWIQALAESPRVGRVVALALRTGRHELPHEVEVRGFGRRGRVATLTAFYRALLGSLRPRPHVLFVYQGGPYPLLLMPFKLVLGIPIVQWKAHPVVTRAMSFYARRCDDLVLTSTRAAFPMQLPKVRVVGQGIDTDMFRPHERQREADLIAVGRITPIKRVEEMIRAVALANERHGAEYWLSICGPVLPADEGYAASIQALIDELGAPPWVRLESPIPQERLPPMLSAHRASINFCMGALDRSVVEAMACALPVISTNRSVSEILPADLRPVLIADERDLEMQASTIHDVLRRTDQDLAALGVRLRDLVVREQSVDRLVDRILDEIESELRSRA